MWPNLSPLGECIRKTASSVCGPLKKLQARPSCSQWAGNFLLVSVSSARKPTVTSSFGAGGRIWLCWKHSLGWVWILLVLMGGGDFFSATVLISISFLLPLLQEKSCHWRSWNKKIYFPILIRNWMSQGSLLVWNFTLKVKVKLCFLSARIVLLPTALWCATTATEPQLQPFKSHSKYNRAS